jgi:ABC-type lipoprotein release transport system permease subunit
MNRSYAAAAIAIVVCAATMVIPARRAARTQPADVLPTE